MPLGRRSINAPLKFDLPWPAWTQGEFSVKLLFNRPAKSVDQSQSTWFIHEIFMNRPSEVKFLKADKKSAFVISDGKDCIGELWLRLALFPRENTGLFIRFCEAYSYKFGWRDELTAKMDEQSPGGFMIPRRSNDLLCQFIGNSAIVLIDGTFCAKLQRKA